MTRKTQDAIKICQGIDIQKRNRFRQHSFRGFNKVPGFYKKYQSCLLYTSDAADE